MSRCRRQPSVVGAGTESFVDALPKQIDPPGGGGGDLAIACVPCEAGSHKIRVARGRRVVGQVALNERRPAVEWREIDLVDRDARTNQSAQ